MIHFNPKLVKQDDFLHDKITARLLENWWDNFIKLTLLQISSILKKDDDFDYFYCEDYDFAMIKVWDVIISSFMVSQEVSEVIFREQVELFYYENAKV